MTLLIPKWFVSVCQQNSLQYGSKEITCIIMIIQWAVKGFHDRSLIIHGYTCSKVHVEEAGMTAYLFKLHTEKTIYCKNVF